MPLLIHATQKLLAEIPAALIDHNAVGESWHANLLRIDRRKCVLFTHDATLYSVFVPELRKPDFVQLDQVFGQRLFKALLWEGFPQPLIECMLDACRSVRFTRFNIYARDRHRCQYCGCRLLRSELNLDHVVPRSRGGASTWDNVVCSCRRCNRIKGGRTPEEAGMHLRRRPFRPKWSPFLVDEVGRKRYKEWLPYLGAVDGTWRNLEETERSAG